MLYQCVDPDCQRWFESEFQPPTILGKPFCPECAIAFDALLKELAEKGVKISIGHGSDN